LDHHVHHLSIEVALVPDPVMENHETNRRPDGMDIRFELGEKALINLQIF
jgi:hypothetical protein